VESLCFLVLGGVEGLDLVKSLEDFGVKRFEDNCKLMQFINP
jgi:hypothetical protein